MKNCKFHNTLTVRTLLRVFMGSTRMIPKFRDLGLSRWRGVASKASWRGDASFYLGRL